MDSLSHALREHFRDECDATTSAALNDYARELFDARLRLVRAGRCCRYKHKKRQSQADEHYVGASRSAFHHTRRQLLKNRGAG